MADQLLPSRDVALGILNGTYDEDAGARIVADLLRGVASGRLVDREAIDRTAAFEVGIKQWTLVHSGQRPGQEMRAYLWNFLEATFDAALGDTDNA